MNLLSIMRSYNNCVLRENAKLKSIYNRLIKECDGAETAEPTDECDACGDPECKDGEICGLKENDKSKKAKAAEPKKADPEDDETMTAESFFGEAAKGEEGEESAEPSECDVSETKAKTSDGTASDDRIGLAKQFFGMNEEDGEEDAPHMMSDSDFFGAVEEAKKKGEKKADDGMLSGAEFYSKSNSDVDADSENTNEAEDKEDLMTAEEFFGGVAKAPAGKKPAEAAAESEEKDEPKKDEPKKDEPKKDEPKKDEPKKDEPKTESKKDEPKTESKKDEPEDDDEALEESLSKYQKANRRLFS